MPDDPSNPDIAEWTRAIDAGASSRRTPSPSSFGGRHIALFVHQGEVLACNNRCPHEGYPLVEGALSARTAARSALCAPSGAANQVSVGVHQPVAC